VVDRVVSLIPSLGSLAAVAPQHLIVAVHATLKACYQGSLLARY
jgi:hypothetical protein